MRARVVRKIEKKVSLRARKKVFSQSVVETLWHIHWPAYTIGGRACVCLRIAHVKKGHHRVSFTRCIVGSRALIPLNRGRGAQPTYSVWKASTFASKPRLHPYTAWTRVCVRARAPIENFHKRCSLSYRRVYQLNYHETVHFMNISGMANNSDSKFVPPRVSGWIINSSGLR